VKNYNKIARQAGMTLIELTVVLLVLIGLAGLMIPYVGGFVSKTHDSTGSDSLASVNSAIQRYDVQFLGMPNNFDSLTEDDLTTGTVYSKMMGGITMPTMTNNYLKQIDVEGIVFTNAGIESLVPMDSATASATFNATLPAVTLSSSTTYKLNAINVKGSACTGAADAMGCIASDSDLGDILGRTVDTSVNDYIVLGVGQESSMVGKTISEAPVHFAQTGAMSADNKYNRIVAIFEVPNATTVTNEGFCIGKTSDGTAVVVTSTMMTCEAVVTSPATAGEWTMVMRPKAKFITTAMPMMVLEGLGGALQSHYSSVDN